MTLRKLIAAFVTTAAAVAAQADTVYKTAWVQDFEDSDTYAAQFSVCSISNAILGTVDKAIESRYSGVYSQAERTIYNASKTSKFWRTYTNKVKGGYYSLFTIPTSAGLASAREYKVDFDTLVSHPVGTGAQNGTVVQGALGPIATFNAPPGSNADNKSSTMTIYAQDDSTRSLGTVVSFNRGQDPADSKWAKYWIHVTVRGVYGDGIYLTVTRADGTVAVAEQKISETFDYVTEIFFRMNNSAGSYDDYCSLDDVFVSYPNSGSTFTWTGAAGDGLWSTPGNWIEGEDVPLSVPTELDDVVIPADKGVVCIEADVDYKSLTIGEGSSLGLLVSGVAELSTVYVLPQLADGSTLSAEQVVVCGPYEKGVSEDGTAITAMRVPSTFVWNVQQGIWKQASNWKVGDNVSGDVPGLSDQVVFPQTAAIVVNDESLAVSNVVVTTDATLTVSGNKYIYAYMFNGEGTLRLNGGLLGNVNTSHGVISNNIEVVEGTTNDILVGNGGGCQITFYGNLSGSGNLRVDENGKNSAGLNLYSKDNSAFSGSFEVINSYAGTQRSNTRFFTAGASSSNAVWTLRGNATGNIFQQSNATYYFGALNNNIYEGSSYSGIVLEIGARNVDCAFSGCISRYDDKDHRNYGTKIRKVGTAKLTIDTTYTGTVEINGGTFAFAQASALPNATDYGDYWLQFGGGTLEATGVDPSALIKKSEGAISVFVGNETNETWTTALASSNVGGLVKKGAGALTLTSDGAATPTLGYKGYTRVEAGKLAIAEGTHYTWDITSPVALASAVEGATPTGYGVGTAQTNWVYGVNSWSDVNKTVDITNLKTIDLTSVTEIAKNQKFVIMTAKAFQLNGAAMTKAQREAITVELNDAVKTFAAAKGYSLKVEGNNLVYAPRGGFLCIIR